ncbi:MAG: sigma-54-dependent Fis family transcriptional regulator [Gammaproteobacteria bacterium]
MANDTLNQAQTDQDRRLGAGTHRRREDRELSETLLRQLQFEKLVARLSATFINLADDKVGSAITDALREMSEFLLSDFSTFIVADPQTGDMQHSHQWVAPGVEAEIDFINFDIKRDAPWVGQKLAQGKPFAINNLSDLPRQASREKVIIRDLGIGSILWVPLQLQDRIAGAIVINRMGPDESWAPELEAPLKLIGEILINALARKQISEKHRGRLRFEELLSRLSAEFIDISSDTLDQKIHLVLGEVGEYANCDETFLVQFKSPTNESGVSHSWFRDDRVRDLNFDIQQFLEVFPWAAGRLNRGEPVQFGSLAELPSEAVAERAYLESEGILSAIVVPFLQDEKLLGLLFVQGFRERSWLDYLTQQVYLLAQIFFSTLQRNAADQKLQAALVEIGWLKDQLEAENELLQHEIEILSAHGEIVGDSPALKAVIEQAQQVAPLDSIVLIEGETGVGKELVANLIHRESPRSNKKMVRVNCAALPAALIEAELFGRDKGAYTGALSKQVGRFELADGSTLFLDEIGELPLELQAKLLRVLQEGEFERLGSTRTLKVDVRVIAATNCELSSLVGTGKFREDLYYRLNVFPIRVPPLRARRADIPALVWSFVRDCSENMGKSIDKISKSTMQRLQAYNWPGNVRELRNVIERSMILSRNNDLAVSLGEIGNENQGGQTLKEVERNHIRAILEQTGWRVRGEAGAARILDLNPTTLESRMKKLGIRRPDK